MKTAVQASWTGQSGHPSKNYQPYRSFAARQQHENQQFHKMQIPTVALFPASSLLLLATPVRTSKERPVVELSADTRASPHDATTRVQLTTRRRRQNSNAIGDRFKVKPITVGPTFTTPSINHNSTSNGHSPVCQYPCRLRTRISTDQATLSMELNFVLPAVTKTPEVLSIRTIIAKFVQPRLCSTQHELT